MQPSADDKAMGLELVDGFFGDSGTVVRNFIHARSILSNPPLALTPEFEQIAEGEGEIRDNEMQRAGFDETLTLLGSFSVIVSTITDLRTQLAQETSEDAQQNLQEQIDTAVETGIVLPLAEYIWKHHKYPVGATQEGVIESCRGEIAENYEKLTRQCFDESLKEPNCYEFVQAVRRRIFNTPPTEQDYQLPSEGQVAELAEAFQHITFEMGWGALAPMNRTIASMRDGLQQWQSYVGKSKIVHMKKQSGKIFEAAEKETEAMAAHAQALKYWNATLESMNDPVFQEILASSDIGRNEVRLSEEAIQQSIGSIQALKSLLKGTSLEYANRKTADAYNALNKSSSSEKKCAEYFMKRSMGMLITANDLQEDVTRFLSKAEKFSAHAKEVGYIFTSSDEDFRDICYGMRNITHRLELVMSIAESLYADAAEITKNNQHSNWACSTAEDREEDADYVAPPATQGEKFKQFLSRLQQSCEVLHDAAGAQCSHIKTQSASLDGSLDGFDIMQHNMQRMQRNITALVERMNPRQAVWDAQQKSPKIT